MILFLKSETQAKLNLWSDLLEEEMNLSSLPARRLAKKVAELSDMLVGKERLTRYFNDAELLQAYATFFFPQTFARTYFVVREMLELSDFKERVKKVKVLDLGAGMGASSFAVWEALKPFFPSVEIEAVDLAEKVLRTLMELAEARGMKGVKVIQKDMRKIKGEGYNLVVASASLSELTSGIGGVVKTVFSKLASPGAFIVIEPAWKKGFDLIRRISRILRQSPLLPCLLSQKCSLEKREDWCFVSLDLELPLFTYRVNQLLRHNLNYVKFTYGVFVKGLNLKVKGARVISPLKKQKGKSLVRVCNEGEVFWLERLDKDSSPLNQQFEEVGCCDIVEFECKSEGNVRRLERENLFRKLK